MIIRVKDQDDNLLAKDILDISFDMSVKEQRGNKYVVQINSKYTYDEEFESKEDAQKQLIYLADCRNNLEDELRSSY